MKKTEHTIDRFPYLWKPKRGIFLLAMVLAVLLLWVPAPTLAQEPTPRATPTPAFLLELMPQTGMPGTIVVLRGYGFHGAAQVNVTWDGDPLLEYVDVRADGGFETQFEVPVDIAGEHILRVAVMGDPDTWAEIIFDLFLPTPTPTLTLTPTLTPTYTPRPTNTRPPTSTSPPTNTPLPTSTLPPTMTPTPKPTLRPATPIRLQPTAAPATPTYGYRPPTATYIVRTPTATFVVQTPTATAVTGTPTATFVTRPSTVTVTPATITPAPTDTITAPTAQAATATSTPTVALIAAFTATPTPTSAALPADDELANTGIGPFVMVVMGGLLLGVGALGLRHLRANMLA